VAPSKVGVYDVQHFLFRNGLKRGGSLAIMLSGKQSLLHWLYRRSRWHLGHGLRNCYCLSSRRYENFVLLESCRSTWRTGGCYSLGRDTSKCIHFCLAFRDLRKLR
jgi:hypothetical protein